MLMGSIMRTFMVLSLGLLPFGNFAGSKSGGKYLLRTLRSPMLAFCLCYDLLLLAVVRYSGFDPRHDHLLRQGRYSRICTCFK